MLNLAIIFHMHQPYYNDLLGHRASLPWVRLHGVKDYLDMVETLEKFPRMRLVFNLVPSLLEQIEDYTSRRISDNYLELSRKRACDLNAQEKKFILENFFSINRDKVISLFPRYLELYFKKKDKKEFNQQDYLDLQLLFNLSWIDPLFRARFPELRAAMNKGRFFSEEDKQAVLDRQEYILEDIIPAYDKFAQNKQAELTLSPFYHPILPLLFSTDSARDARPGAILPKTRFSYPEDVGGSINEALDYFKKKFKVPPAGMWPSEEAVSESILPYIIRAGIKWIVADEAILFKSMNLAHRDTKLLYQPHLLKREEGQTSIVFRDRNLSDLIGFNYQSWGAQKAVDDFMRHLQQINKTMHSHEALVVVAMDGENAWEYYDYDGHEFLELLYQAISDSKFVRSTTVNDYLSDHAPRKHIDQLASGSWIYGEFAKWIGSPYKNKAWEWLALARKELDQAGREGGERINLELAVKQMRIAEGSDWFWWYGEDPAGDFDNLFRMHLRNFYSIIKKKIPACLNSPLVP